MNLDIRPDLSAAPWDDLDHLIPEYVGTLTRVGLLPDGRRVLGQTTWQLFNTAARALAASPTVTALGPLL